MKTFKQHVAMSGHTKMKVKLENALTLAVAVLSRAEVSVLALVALVACGRRTAHAFACDRITPIQHVEVCVPVTFALAARNTTSRVPVEAGTALLTSAAAVSFSAVDANMVVAVDRVRDAKFSQVSTHLGTGTRFAGVFRSVLGIAEEALGTFFAIASCGVVATFLERNRNSDGDRRFDTFFLKGASLLSTQQVMYEIVTILRQEGKCENPKWILHSPGICQ